MSRPDANEPWTVGRIQLWTQNFLAERGIPNPRLDSDLLIAHAMEFDRVQVYTRFDQPLTLAERDRIRPLVRRRADREPLAFITGKREFYGLSFKVTSDTLIPRPETEHLVEAAIDGLKNRPDPTFLDLGTGTGCIPISLLTQCPTARGVAVDLSKSALEVAETNAAQHGVADRLTLLQGSWFEPLENARYDLITANPPYIPSAELDTLQPEVANHEPRLALDGGDDGLASIRVILQGAPARLAAGGELLMEIAENQAEAISRVVQSMEGWTPPEFIKDYSGIERTLKIARTLKIERSGD